MLFVHRLENCWMSERTVSYYGFYGVQVGPIIRARVAEYKHQIKTFVQFL